MNCYELPVETRVHPRKPSKKASGEEEWLKDESEEEKRVNVDLENIHSTSEEHEESEFMKKKNAKPKNKPPKKLSKRKKRGQLSRNQLFMEAGQKYKHSHHGSLHGWTLENINKACGEAVGYANYSPDAIRKKGESINEEVQTLLTGVEWWRGEDGTFSYQLFEYVKCRGQQCRAFLDVGCTKNMCHSCCFYSNASQSVSQSNGSQSDKINSSCGKKAHARAPDDEAKKRVLRSDKPVRVHLNELKGKLDQISNVLGLTSGADSGADAPVPPNGATAPFFDSPADPLVLGSGGSALALAPGSGGQRNSAGPSNSSGPMDVGVDEPSKKKQLKRVRLSIADEIAKRVKQADQILTFLHEDEPPNKRFKISNG